jgi:hypothetical protein
MNEFVGRFIEAGVAVESTRGTAESTASKWVKNVTSDIILNVDKVVDDTTRGRFESNEKTRKVREWYQGELSGILHADVAGYLFLNVYGAVDSEALGSGAYKHTFSVLNAIKHPTLSLFVKDGGVNQVVIPGAVIDTIGLTATTDDYIRFTADIVGKTGNANSDTASYDTEYDFISRDISIKVADTEAGLGAAPELKVKELSINYDLGIISNFVFKNYNPDNIFQSRMVLDGSITLDYTDDTFKDLFNSDDMKYVQVKIEGEANIGGGAKPTITLLMNKVMVTNWERAGGQDELVTQTVEFQAFYNDTDEQASSLEIINTTEEYVPES